MDQRIEFTPVQVVTLTAVLLLAFAASLGMAFNVDAIALSFSASNFDAGKVASTELAAIAAGNLIFARLASRMDPHRVYLFGALAIFAFNAASLFATDVGDLLLLRAPAGFALGAVVSTVMATAARSATPELTFGIINSMVGVMGMGLALVLPRALNAHEFANVHLSFGGVVWNELDGLFAVYVLCSLAVLPFIRHTPGQTPAALQQSGGAPKGIGWLALFGLGIIFHGHGTLALFLVKIGREVPLDAAVVGYVMMAGAFIGIVAPLVAGYVGSRTKPLAPLLILTGLLTLSGLALSNLSGPMAFIIATPVFAVLPTAFMPIMLGVLSRLDPSGALAGSHPAFVLLGGALAPFVGGFISDAAGGFAANGAFAVLCFAVGLGLCWPVLWRAQRPAAGATGG